MISLAKLNETDYRCSLLYMLDLGNFSKILAYQCRNPDIHFQVCNLIFVRLILNIVPMYFSYRIKSLGSKLHFEQKR